MRETSPYDWPANLGQLLDARPELDGVGIADVSTLGVMSA